MIKKSRLLLASLIILTLCLSIFPYNLIPKVWADSSNSGFNFFTDHFVLADATVGSYVTFDVSGYIPSGSTGAIIEIVNEASTWYGYYMRHPDSTDDYYIAGSQAGYNHHYHVVAVNSAREFEAKKQHTAIVYYLIGYTDSNVVLETNLVDYSLGVTTSWETVDASSDVPSGATGVIMLTKTGISAYEFGVRHPDSTDVFKRDVVGLSLAMCGINSAREFESYIEHTDVDMYLLGYTNSPVTFKTNWDDVSLGSTGSWDDVDVTAETIEDATGCLIYIDYNGLAWYKGGLREDGSTNDLNAYSKGYIEGYVSGLVGLGTGEIFEGYIDNVACDFYVIGYVEEASPSTEIYPDHVEDYYDVTNSTHTLLNNGTYAVIGATGWISWDFGESVENVTRINWDIAYTQTSGVFRIEGSVDALSWDILGQTDPNLVGSPPASNYYWSRYDSEMHTRYRYFRITPIYNVVVDWYVDSFWLTVQPPAIVYDDGSFVYPTEIEYFHFEPTYNRYFPYTTLGKNDTNTTEVLMAINQSSALVNIDHNPANWIVVKFSDYYNITSAQVHASCLQGTGHFYLYISTTGDSDDWTLVGDWSGVQTPNWYGATINGTRIRYMRVDLTDVGAMYLHIESFRIIGSIHSGVGNGVEEYEWEFYLFPNWLADALGIPVLAGQLLASACILACFLLPFAFYERRSFWATIIVGLVVFAFLVALGWLPTWLMLLLTLLIASLFGYRFSKWWGGR